jgi:DNA-binding transcriptional MerR regulator
MKHVLLLLPLFLAGCGLFKERTGEYVTEAVVDHIAEKVDQRLERRGLSINQIRDTIDINNDGSVDMDEVKETAKLAARELALAKTAEWEQSQREQWNTATKNLVTRDEQAGIKGDIQDFWLWLKATFGLSIMTILGYLTKQVFSAKSDGRRDAEIAKANARTDALERLLGRDLNQDGRIGSNGDPVPDPATEV